MSEGRITQTFTVRGRPVGYLDSGHGGALVAMERGHCPVSPTGYWSLSGLRRESVDAELLERLATERDQERKAVLTRANFEVQAGPNRLFNYIHLSGSAEKAFHDGFFATDAQRQELWPAAFKLFAIIDADERFQPVPANSVWTEESCAAALAKTRHVLAVLKRCANGDFPVTFPSPVPLVNWAPNGYFRLPPKKEGEPVVALPAITVELSLGEAALASKTKEKPTPARASGGESAAPPTEQMGLFDSGSDTGPRTGVGLGA
jgi:hypothetical protein